MTEVVAPERRHVVGPSGTVCVRCGEVVTPERWETEVCLGPKRSAVTALKQEIFDLFLVRKPGLLADMFRGARAVVKRAPAKAKGELEAYVRHVTHAFIDGAPDRRRPVVEAELVSAPPAQAASPAQAGAGAQASEEAGAQAAPPPPAPAGPPMHCGRPMLKTFPNVGRAGVSWVWRCQAECGYLWKQPPA